MQFRLKPLSQQTIVITGATSGIGLCTARMAAKRGANVVAIARNEAALCELVDAEYMPCNGTAASEVSLPTFINADKLPISITLIKPTAIHTPFPENARNYLSYEPQLPPPLYAPDLVAEAILHCAENPTRDFFVGGMAKVHSSMALNTPRLHEKVNESMIDSMQNSGEPTAMRRSDGLYDTNSRLSERGAQDRRVLEHSLYQRAKLHPALTATIAVAGGVALAAWLGSKASNTATSNANKIDPRDCVVL
ncbi:MAG TPA: SDR family NAD(P)-dependent oxidoreductase [Pyrinomonadaceae bacterium]|nr:SDR family NAD(P)-dependent oxidoreductase [Pyrinomonadaceae bacterium]